MPLKKNFSVPYDDLPDPVRNALRDVIEHQRALRINTLLHIPIGLFIITLPTLSIKFSSHNKMLRLEYLRLVREIQKNRNHASIRKLLAQKDANWLIINRDQSIGTRKTSPFLTRPPLGYVPIPNPLDKKRMREWRKKKLVRRY